MIEVPLQRFTDGAEGGVPLLALISPRHSCGSPLAGTWLVTLRPYWLGRLRTD
jgi:hypothetical protein